jgi:succinoglycan biosynthesis protein ExoA
MSTHDGTVSARYLAPPTAVLAMLAGTVAGLVGIVTGTPLALLGWLLPGGYALTVLAAGLLGGRGLPWPVRLRLPLVLAVMHVSWGWGFLTSRPRVLLPDRTPDGAGRGGLRAGPDGPSGTPRP